MFAPAFLAALTLTAVTPVNITDDTRLDFNCATSAAWMIAGQPEREKASILPLYTFFLGRLSARDPSQDWFAAVNASTRRGELPSDALAELDVCGDIYSQATHQR